MTAMLISLAVLSTLALFATQVSADRVDDFLLLDQKGDAHRLYYHQDASAIVLMTQDNRCAATEVAVKQLQALADNASDNADTRFLLLNASLNDSRAEIARYAEQHQLSLPILDDETQLIGESLDISRAGEVLIINPSQWTVVHRGPIDSASAALTDLQNGKDVPQSAPVSGCEIDFPHKNATAHQQISYSKTIAPMLKDKCVSCHTEGGLGPWAMSGYNMVLGFAPMIREVVRT